MDVVFRTFTEFESLVFCCRSTLRRMLDKYESDAVVRNFEGRLGFLGDNSSNKCLSIVD